MASKNSIGRSSRPKIEWPTISLIIATYGSWVGACFYLWPNVPILAVLALSLILAMQSSLMHEASHGHPTRKAWINELLVGLPIGLVYPYRRFKSLHLRHHADESLTDPFDDPESYYLSFWNHEELPRWLRKLLAINNTMIGRFVLGPPLGTIGFLLEEARLIAAGDQAVRRAWLRHLLGLAIVLPLVTKVFGIPFWLYLLGPVWLGQSFISVRTFAEHQWSERPDGRTIIVERSPFAFLFLNNNLHLVHHKSPTVAWYRLPRLFRERREEWITMNRGYVFPNYRALLKSYAFRAKEPVAHPVLHRDVDISHSFTPYPSGSSVTELDAVQMLDVIPILTEPPKEW